VLRAGVFAGFSCIGIGSRAGTTKAQNREYRVEYRLKFAARWDW
jgi:hypothetical protein